MTRTTIRSGNSLARRAPSPHCTTCSVASGLCDRLGMSVVPAGEGAKQIEAVYKAGIDVGYFKAQPSGDTIYTKPMK